MIPLSGKIPHGKRYSAFFDIAVSLDLFLILFWLAAAIAAIYLPVLTESPLRIVLALPAVFFIPGYCFIAALFPGTREIESIERVMLSVGFSIVVVPLIGLGLNFTPFGIKLEPIVVFLTLFTFVMVLVAHYRRALLRPEERFRIPFSELTGRVREGLLPQGETGNDRFLSVILALVMIVTIVTTVFVVVSPANGERFSEFYILNENLTYTDYPDKMILEKNYPIYIGVGNMEKRDITYTVEIWFEQIETDKITNTSRIITMDPAGHLDLAIADNETQVIPYNLFIYRTGYDRINFLLFNETVPGPEVTGMDRVNASYREVHLWLKDT